MRALGPSRIAAAVLILLLLPASAAGGTIPPGNGAANQYTEAVPTGGGSDPSSGRGELSPAAALGKRRAGELEALGADGRAAASLAAATDPAAAPLAEPGAAGGPASGGAQSGGGAAAQHAAPAVDLDASGSGTSGPWAVLGEMTGTSSNGNLGPLLPLIVLASVAVGAGWAMRRRHAA